MDENTRMTMESLMPNYNLEEAGFGFQDGFTACHDLMTKELEEFKAGKEGVTRAANTLRNQRDKLRTDLALAVEALEKLKDRPCNHEYSGECDGCTYDVMVGEALSKINKVEEKK